jgi:hypothetical protein
MAIEANIDSECENSIPYVTFAQDDSGYFCDSDSGISSLYETIRKQSYLGNCEEKDRLSSNSSGNISQNEKHKEEMKIKVNIQHLEPSLRQIFLRDYQRTIASEQFEYKFDLGMLLNLTAESDVDDCCKRHLTEVVMRRHKLLNRILSNLSQELQIVDNNISTLETKLYKSVSAHELKLYRSSVNKITVIVNLIFGLELRLCEYNPSNPNLSNISILRRRLSEASDIKLRHDNSLHTVGGIVRNRLGISSYLTFRQMVKSKQRLICQVKIVKMELYWVETQMKLLHLLF